VAGPFKGFLFLQDLVGRHLLMSHIVAMIATNLYVIHVYLAQMMEFVSHVAKLQKLLKKRLK
jgi:hypothetical protein